MKSKSYGNREERLAVMKKIAELDLSAPWPVQAQRVVEIFDGVSGDVWTTIDNAGGNAALPDVVQEKFHIVRQVRNHPEWHKKLYAGIK